MTERIFATLDDLAGQDTAAEIAFTPAGTIAATDVQAAIEEVATDAAAALAAITAADVAFTPAGDVAATDVQAAIEELDAEKQPLDTDLTALSALASTGIVARTAAATYALRTVTGPAAGISVSNGDGVSGNPTLALANDLAALEALASTGLAARTAADTWAQRAVAVTAANGGIAVSNGNGVSGNPTLSLHALLENLAGLTTAADRGVYWTALNTSALFTLTSAGRAILDDATAAAQRTTLGAFGRIESQEFTASGTYTPTAGMLYVIVEIVGGGGGGGGAATSIAGAQYGGGGGAGGTYSRRVLTAAQVGASQSVTIGAAGSAGSAGGGNGGTGGTTSFGSLVTAPGGAGGTGRAVPNAGPGGAAGATGTADLSIPGMPGFFGVGYSSIGGRLLGGAGGNSYFGWGGTPTSGGAGNAGSGYGAGGGGAMSSNGSPTNPAGGAGAAGYVIITEFLPQ